MRGRWPPAPRPGFGSTGAYHLLELHALSERVRQRAPLRARLAIRFLTAASLGRDEAVMACLRTERADLLRLRRERGAEAIAVFARYVLSTTQQRSREAMMAQIQRIDDELAEDFVSAYDAILAEGVGMGMEKGLAAGMEKGLAAGSTDCSTTRRRRAGTRCWAEVR